MKDVLRLLFRIIGTILSIPITIIFIIWIFIILPIVVLFDDDNLWRKQNILYWLDAALFVIIEIRWLDGFSSYFK